MTPQSIVPLGWPVVPSSVGQTGPLLEIQSSATDSIRIQEITFMVAAGGSNAAAPVGIGIPAIKGVGVGGVTPILDNSSDTSVAPQLMLYMLWTKQPTSPINFLRRATLQSQNSVNSVPTIRFSFIRGLTMAPSSSLVIWGISFEFFTLSDVLISLDG